MMEILQTLADLYADDEIVFGLDMTESMVDYESYEEDLGEGYKKTIIVGFDRLVRDFNLEVRDDSELRNWANVKNQKANLMVFSILHEIGHSNVSSTFGGRAIRFYDDCLRFMFYKVLDVVDHLIFKHERWDLMKTRKLHSSRIYYKLPEERFANKFADDNVLEAMFAIC